MSGEKVSYTNWHSDSRWGELDQPNNGYNQGEVIPYGSWVKYGAGFVFTLRVCAVHLYLNYFLYPQEDYSASCKTDTGSFAWYDVGPPRPTNPGLSGQGKNLGWAYCSIPRLSIGEKLL